MKAHTPSVCRRNDENKTASPIIGDIPDRCALHYLSTITTTKVTTTEGIPNKNRECNQHYTTFTTKRSYKKYLPRQRADYQSFLPGTFNVVKTWCNGHTGTV